MDKQLLKDGLGWGIALWFVGYVLGIVLFMLVPLYLLGWIITPIGIIITLWVLFKKIKSSALVHYIAIAVIWTLIAVVCDYALIVKLFGSTEYYKLDVYLYYAFTFALPLIVGFKKSRALNSVVS